MLLRINRVAQTLACLTLVVAYLAPAPAAELRQVGASVQNRKLGRGVNIIGYDPIWRSFEEGRFKARHFRLGEFGAYDKAPMDSRDRYTNAVARTAEKLGWSWAYWQFDSDFILYDIDNDRWVRPIHDALIPKEP